MNSGKRSIGEIFSYWLQAGRVDIGFLGAAQIDRYANLNTTVIGDYAHPAVRLPGAGGAPEIAALAGEVLVTLRHNPRAFVEKVDFITSPGYLDGGASRNRLRLPGKGPTAAITDLGTLTPDPVTRELTLTSIHPGVTVEEVRNATGWPLCVAPRVTVTERPRANELAVLRELHERTARAHGSRADLPPSPKALADRRSL